MIRMPLVKLSCVVFFSSAFFGAHAQCARLVLAADPDYPPLHWYDGSAMHGASITIAKRVLDDLKIP